MLVSGQNDRLDEMINCGQCSSDCFSSSFRYFLASIDALNLAGRARCRYFTPNFQTIIQHTAYSIPYTIHPQT